MRLLNRYLVGVAFFVHVSIMGMHKRENIVASVLSCVKKDDFGRATDELIKKHKRIEKKDFAEHIKTDFIESDITHKQEKNGVMIRTCAAEFFELVHAKDKLYQKHSDLLDRKAQLFIEKSKTLQAKVNEASLAVDRSKINIKIWSGAFFAFNCLFTTALARGYIPSNSCSERAVLNIAEGAMFGFWAGCYGMYHACDKALAEGYKVEAECSRLYAEYCSIKEECYRYLKTRDMFQLLAHLPQAKEVFDVTSNGLSEYPFVTTSCRFTELPLAVQVALEMCSKQSDLSKPPPIGMLSNKVIITKEISSSSEVGKSSGYSVITFPKVDLFLNERLWKICLSDSLERPGRLDTVYANKKYWISVLPESMRQREDLL